MDPNCIIWAPFLLLHLGGPDTITAYSLEDNELWLRHLLSLISQSIGAVIVVYGSWNGTKLNYVTIPVMVAGIIKYGERTCSLWLGSSEKFRKSILPPPDPGPNYAKFMDDCTAKRDEGYIVELKVESSTVLLDQPQGEIVNDSVPDAALIHNGFYFLEIFECLFADLILGFQDHRDSQKLFQKMEWNDAFQVVAVELGLMYDKLYTKAVVTYSRKGIFLKIVSFFCTLSAFIAFFCLVEEAYYQSITVVLFAVAIFLEIYAAIVLLSSPWTMHWLSKHKNQRVDLLLSCFKECYEHSHAKRWSNLMSQLNLFSFCLKGEPTKRIKIWNFQFMYKLFKKFYHQKPENVPDELKKLIFIQLLEKSRNAKDMKECKILCGRRGDWVLDGWKCDSIKWSTTELEFDESLLLWHIATDLCYHSDEDCAELRSYRLSKMLSDYMLYLLIKCPFMLPTGIGQIRFEDTCAEVSQLLQERKHISQIKQVCQVIDRVSVDEKFLPSVVKGDRSKSVLFDAHRLAKSLDSLGPHPSWSKEEKWEVISDVWVEMLCHAASQCRGFQHAKQLSRGGELLTHVWFLMAHLGITEQFQISQGHARAKLILT
ncbi:unnamed protein product [Sphenostylis stenocarpa]|uniref:DUF4220 domain-containing protein n=1 Tax=Sphenostylis stenocarpa TaxID=92480 RepID=A0AA86W1D7_9FABA|nr:unnamed protein product [Sphenostylis stenocarpa]